MNAHDTGVQPSFLSDRRFRVHCARCGPMLEFKYATRAKRFATAHAQTVDPVPEPEPLPDPRVRVIR